MCKGYVKEMIAKIKNWNNVRQVPDHIKCFWTENGFHPKTTVCQDCKDYEKCQKHHQEVLDYAKQIDIDKKQKEVIQ